MGACKKKARSILLLGEHRQQRLPKPQVQYYSISWLRLPAKLVGPSANLGLRTSIHGNAVSASDGACSALQGALA